MSASRANSVMQKYSPIQEQISWLYSRHYLAILVLFVFLVDSLGNDSMAQTTRVRFRRVITQEVKGDVVVTGNTLLHCEPNNEKTDCFNNKNRQMYVLNTSAVSGVNAPNSGLFNASSATVTLPSNAKIIAARLYWGATLHLNPGDGDESLPPCGTAQACTKGSPAPRDQVKLHITGMSKFENIAGKLIGPNNATQTYHTGADILQVLPTKSPSGVLTFTVANVQASRGIQRHAGWSVVIVYNEPDSSSTPQRQLTVFEGFARALRNTRDIELGNIKIPQAKRPKVRFWTYGYEGDSHIDGDTLLIQRRPVGDIGNKDVDGDENYFKGIIPEVESSRNLFPKFTQIPNYINNAGTDIQRHNAPKEAVFSNVDPVTIRIRTIRDGLTYGVFALMSDLDPIERNLTITKTASAPVVVAGEQIQYTVTVVNEEGPAVTGAKVVDTLPEQVIEATWTCKASAGSICQDEKGSGNINSSVDLASGGTATFMITGKVKSSARDEFTNTACVNAPGGVDENDQEDNCASVNTRIEIKADLSVTKTDELTKAARGARITYLIVAKNDGPSDVQGARLRDSFPADFKDSKWECIPSAGARCEAPSGAGNLDLKLDLPAGGFVTITASGVIANTQLCELRNSVQIDPPGNVTDPDRANNTAVDVTELDCTADLVISKTDSKDPIAAGETLNYVITVTNRGVVPATGIVIKDMLPPDVEFLSADAGGRGTCNTATDAGRTIVSCNMDGALAPLSEKMTISVSVRVLATTPGGKVLTNTATVSAQTSDPDLTNNSTEENTRVIADFDLCITKIGKQQIGKYQLGNGYIVTYKITITNAPGNAPAHNVRLIDQFVTPAGGIIKSEDIGPFELIDRPKECDPLNSKTKVKCDWKEPIKPGECRTVELKYFFPLKRKNLNLCNVASLVQRETEADIRDLNTEDNHAQMGLKLGGGAATCIFPNLRKQPTCPACAAGNQ